MPNPKRYPIHQSPLYRLTSRKRLAQLLEFEVDDFQALTDPNNYRVFLNKNRREIQHPIGRLEVIHRRLSNLLRRIEMPEYLHSQKGRSYITNAAMHGADVPLAKTDISKFYPSTSFSAVFSLFSEQFSCPRDVAWHLAKLCCYRGRLPTGSPISGYVAFLAHQEMFEEISALAQLHQCKMTLLVDDISLSGSGATKTLLYSVRGIIRKYGLSAKEEKSHTFPAGKVKIITGIAVTPQGFRVPNRRLQLIHQERRLLASETIPKARTKRLLALRGRLQEAQNILAMNHSMSV